MPNPTLADMVPFLDDELAGEIQRLIKFEADMKAALRFKEGDEVTLRRSFYFNTNNGWSAYRNMLVSGNPATIQQIYWSEFHKEWWALVSFAVEWSESEWATGIRVYPRRDDARPKCFSFPLSAFRELRVDDMLPAVPVGV